MIVPLVPFANAFAIEILRSLFRVSDVRLRTILATDVHSQREMLTEFKKEFSLRLFMAYILSTSILGVFLWYFIIFTTNYGWTLSWFWILTGLLGVLMRFIIYDLLISIFYWILNQAPNNSRCKKIGQYLS